MAQVASYPVPRRLHTRACDFICLHTCSSDGSVSYLEKRDPPVTPSRAIVVGLNVALYCVATPHRSEEPHWAKRGHQRSQPSSVQTATFQSPGLESQSNDSSQPRSALQKFKVLRGWAQSSRSNFLNLPVPKSILFAPPPAHNRGVKRGDLAGENRPHITFGLIPVATAPLLAAALHRHLDCLLWRCSALIWHSISTGRSFLWRYLCEVGTKETNHFSTK